MLKEMLKLVAFMIMGILWIIQTTVGEVLLPRFQKARERGQWAVVGLIAVIMIPMVILNSITTPWIENNH